MTDLARYAADHGLRHFLFSFSDLFGVQRAKLVPASAVSQVARDGAGFAGFAAWLAMTPADPDVLGLPDPASLAVLPWQRNVAWLATDLQVEGRPLEQSPRWVLRRQLERVDRLGYSFRTGVEAEFFLLEPGGKAIADGHDTQSKPCYDQMALMRQFELIGGLLEAMEELGWGPYQADHEDANGQFEINWTFADALVTADRHALFRVMAQAMAEPLGARVSFGPKPFPQLTGSGAHLHHSLWDSSGRNLFHDPRGELGLSRLAYHFLGGLLEHAPALCAITNPTAESYARLGGITTNSGATWSPGWISYGGNNRSHMVRIPDDQRLELRLADSAANPYLLPAAVLAAGLDGLERELDPGPRNDANLYTDPPAPGTAAPLPTSLKEALSAFAADTVLRQALGEPFCQAYESLQRSNDHGGG
jgi:glutamine synthetase